MRPKRRRLIAGVIFFAGLALANPLAIFAQEDVFYQLNQRVAQAASRGQYVESVTLAKQAIELARKEFGPYHDNVVMMLNTLSSIYASQGKYSMAEKILKRALGIRILAVGDEVAAKNYTEIAAEMRSLAKLYMQAKRYVRSEVFLKRAMKTDELALGGEYPGRLKDLNLLVEIYERRNKTKEAEALYRLLLTDYKKSGAADSLPEAVAANNLARIYIADRRYQDAEALLKRALEINEKNEPSGGAAVSVSLNNLATVYTDEGKYSEAEPLLERSLSIDENRFGKESPDLITGLNNLA
ncbi:MAG: tetratricopeptide repeat protein, partial [Candidatus Omnitrophota bacterium]|nr:tetratricopeptide repeat protein [Candidatus Omnitrophota bacterium]